MMSEVDCDYDWRQHTEQEIRDKFAALDTQAQGLFLSIQRNPVFTIVLFPNKLTGDVQIQGIPAPDNAGARKYLVEVVIPKLINAFFLYKPFSESEQLQIPAPLREIQFTVETQ